MPGYKSLLPALLLPGIPVVSVKVLAHVPMVCPLENKLRGQTLISLAPLQTRKRKSKEDAIQKQRDGKHSRGETNTANTKRKSNSRMKTVTWETLVASAKNFFISSSVNATFMADPLWELKRKQVSSSRDFKGGISVLDTTAQGCHPPLYDRLAKQSPDSSHSLHSWLKERQSQCSMNLHYTSQRRQVTSRTITKNQNKNCGCVALALLPKPLSDTLQLP